MKISKYCSYFLALFFIFNCEMGNGFKPPVKEAEELTNEGWEKFSYGIPSAYQNAIIKFNEAIEKDPDYAEPYSGIGWSNARLTNLAEAISYFNQCLSLNSNHVDAHAGLAFVYNARKNYDSAISSAKEALRINPNWIFVHDQSLSHSDLRLMLAESYFALGNFNECLSQVKILNSTFVANINTFDGRSALAEEIERLRGIV